MNTKSSINPYLRALGEVAAQINAAIIASRALAGKFRRAAVIALIGLGFGLGASSASTRAPDMNVADKAAPGSYLLRTALAPPMQSSHLAEAFVAEPDGDSMVFSIQLTAPDLGTEASKDEAESYSAAARKLEASARKVEFDAGALSEIIAGNVPQGTAFLTSVSLVQSSMSNWSAAATNLLRTREDLIRAGANVCTLDAGVHLEAMQAQIPAQDFPGIMSKLDRLTGMRRGPG